jgi:hypothetical protein
MNIILFGFLITTDRGCIYEGGGRAGEEAPPPPPPPGHVLSYYPKFNSIHSGPHLLLSLHLFLFGGALNNQINIKNILRYT